MNRALRCRLAVLLVLLVPLPLAAEEKQPAGSWTERIAPYVNDLTIAVAHANLAELDPGALADRLLAEPDEAALRKQRQAVEEWVKRFRQAGGEEVFVVVNLDDVPQYPPFVIVPLGPKANPEQLSALLCGDEERSRTAGSKLHTYGRPVCAKLDGVLFFGHSDVLARVRGMTAMPRPELAEAAEAAGDSDAQFVLIPAEDSRRVINQLMPKLPEFLGGAPSSVLTEGVRWASFSLATGAGERQPQVVLRAVIQSEDAAAAEKLRDVIKEGYLALVKQPEVRKTLPNVYDLTKLLTPEVEGDRLVLVLSSENNRLNRLVQMLEQPLARARASARRAERFNRLKQMGLAMHNYHDTYGSFPPAATYDEQGRPLLSWRVLILPFLDQAALYDQFNLDEPWDSPRNKRLIERMPDVYRSPEANLPQQAMTTYLAPIGENTIFPPGGRRVRLADITDGTSNTIMLVEAADEQAAIWTRPEDWKFDPENPLRGLVDEGDDGFPALFADGSVRHIPKDIAPETLRRLFIRNDGQPVPAF